MPAHHPRVDPDARPQEEGPAVGVREAQACAGRRRAAGTRRAAKELGMPSSMARTLDVPPGRTASGTSEPARPHAASEIVPSPPQTATTSRPRGRKLCTIAVASPGPLVGALTSSRPLRPLAVDQRCSSRAADPAGRRSGCRRGFRVCGGRRTRQNSSPSRRGATIPRCRYAAGEATRPRGVRCRKPAWSR